MLQGRTALVTGATGGLGQAIAARLTREGSNVVIHGLLPASEGETVAASLRQDAAGRILYRHADLRDAAAIAAMMADVEAEFGGLDILVNNAVVRHFAPLEDFPPERWEEALAVNLTASFHTMRLALPGMRRRGFGRIVNMASPYSFFAAANRIDYVTTKTAILGMTRAVAIETAGTDITCNAVAPGTSPTPAIEARIAAMAAAQNISVEEATHNYLADRQPGGRFISLEAVAGLVAYLCGPAAREITGAAIPVDSGWTVS